MLQNVEWAEVNKCQIKIRKVCELLNVPCRVAAAPHKMAVTRYTIVVVRLAAIVPLGILP